MYIISKDFKLYYLVIEINVFLRFSVIFLDFFFWNEFHYLMRLLLEIGVKIGEESEYDFVRKSHA